MCLEQLIIAEIERRSLLNQNKEKKIQRMEETQNRNSIIARLKHREEMYMKSRGFY